MAGKLRRPASHELNRLRIIINARLGAASFGNMFLPLDGIASLGEAVGGCDLMPPDDDVSIAPSRADISRLLYLHAAAGQLAEDTPAVLAHPGSARGLEQSLIEAMMRCLGGGEVQEDRAALRQHAAIMRRFHRAIEQQLDQPLYIAELCKEVGASERTLRMCCH
jgi:hypothetical protein